jgi:hypothetical protein
MVGRDDTKESVPMRGIMTMAISIPGRTIWNVTLCLDRTMQNQENGLARGVTVGVQRRVI